ncbi:MAG: xylulose kinase [Chloroflexi bacterium]|nr:xylulose kinase [Chloroflexota bacterium]
MKKQYLFGIDIGSSYTKVSVYDTTGNMLGATKYDTRPSQPSPGIAEYDSDAILQVIYEGIKKLLGKADISPADVAAICLDGMQSGIVGLDADGKPTMPYSSTLDSRFTPYLNQVLAQHHDQIRLKTGSGQPTIAPKILWLRDKFPDIYKRTRKFVTISGYLLAQLAGLSIDEVFIDITYLWVSGLSDTQQYSWDEELCSALNIPIEKLPRIVMPTDIVGGICKRAAHESGLLQGTPIIAGSSDQIAGFTGAGITKPGHMGDNAGTYPIIALCTESFQPDMNNRMAEVLPSAVSGLWNPTSYIIGGGLTHNWFQETFAHTAKDNHGGNYQFLDKKAAQLSPGSDKLFFIPHLGGRACPNNTDYRGSWFGFTWSHKQEHFYKAILESIAYDQYLMYQAMLESYPDVKVKEVIAYGGGSQSPLWNQIKADVMGLPYVCLAREDISALGNAILAGYALGIFDNLTETSEKFIQRSARYEPNPEAHQKYQQYVDYYRSLLAQTEPAFANLTNLS